VSVDKIHKAIAQLHTWCVEVMVEVNSLQLESNQSAATLKPACNCVQPGLSTRTSATSSSSLVGGADQTDSAVATSETNKPSVLYQYVSVNLVTTDSIDLPESCFKQSLSLC
jgi:hypothetical protein